MRAEVLCKKVHLGDMPSRRKFELENEEQGELGHNVYEYHD